jgi:hypothetical protein
MDFVYVALATSLLYALLPANLVRFLASVPAVWVLRALGYDSLHAVLMGTAAFFVAYALNAIIDRIMAVPVSPTTMRLRRGLPDV